MKLSSTHSLTDRQKRRKHRLMLACIYSFLGYVIPCSAVLVAFYLGMTNFPLIYNGAIFAMAACFSLIVFALISVEKEFTARFVNIILFLELFLWLGAYSLFVAQLDGIRPLALLLSFMAFSFLVQNTNTTVLYLLIPSVAIIYFAATCYGLLVLEQEGSIILQLFYAICFIPVGYYSASHASYFGKQKRALQTAHLEIKEQKKLLEDSNQTLVDSLEYAKMIQHSLLPPQSSIQDFIPECFILWEPRDIVGGDLYHLFPLENGCYLIAITDCTGHGVPGALMTMIASSGLRKIIKEELQTDPAIILSKLNRFVKTTLQQDYEESLSDNGLDAAICYVEPAKDRLTFAGARLPLYYDCQGSILFLNGDRHSLGYKRSSLHYEFTNHQLDITDVNTLYLTTDGVIDQKGGKKGFPLGKRKFMEILSEVAELPLEEQRAGFQNHFLAFQEDQIRQDDVTLVGFQP